MWVVLVCGEGVQSSGIEWKAAVQLGLRDEQYMFVMVTHFLRLLIGSVQCALSPSLGSRGRTGGVGPPDLYIASARL